MKLKKLFETCIDIGIEHDVRGREEIEEDLEETAKEKKGLEGLEAEMFDDERTWNPFHDSRILHGDENAEVKVLFAGIDLEIPQVLLAGELRKRGETIDCLFLHHPQGRAKVEMSNDMRLQIELHRRYGVPVVHIEQQIESKIEQTYRMSHGDNIFGWQRTAELVDIPALCCHTPIDNLAYRFFDTNFVHREFDSIGELKNAIADVPEFKHYAVNGLPPLLINCSDKSRTGRIAATGITGGTDGPEVFVKEQAQAGVGTILVMHASDSHKQMAEENHVNIIQVNHYAADELGMNVMFDLLRKKDPKLEIFPGCGFYRVERKEKDLAFLENGDKPGKTRGRR